MAMFTTKKVDGFSHGFRLVDNYSDDSVPSQRNKKSQTEGNGFCDFCSCKIAAARCFIHRCVQVFRHSRSVSSSALTLSQFNSSDFFTCQSIYVPPKEV